MDDEQLQTYHPPSTSSNERAQLEMLAHALLTALPTDSDRFHVLYGLQGRLLTSSRSAAHALGLEPGTLPEEFESLHHGGFFRWRGSPPPPRPPDEPLELEGVWKRDETSLWRINFHPVVLGERAQAVLGTYERKERGCDFSAARLLESLPGATAVLQEDGVLCWANEAFCDLWSLALEPGTSIIHETQRHSLLPLRPSEAFREDPGESPSPIAQGLERGRIEEELLLWEKEGSQRVLSWSLQPIEDSSRHLFLCAFQDITERHELSLHKDEILSIASHELRSPLTPLKGFLQMAHKQQSKTGRIDDSLLHKASHQVGKLTRLVDTLLDLSRLETGRLLLDPKLEPPGTTVRAIVEDWRMVHEERPVEFLDHTAREDRCALDVEFFEQVLVNLLDNAAKFSSPEHPIEVHVTSDEQIVRVTVQDYGKGIETEHLEHVFERFYRAPGLPVVKGLGLGLYISRRIIEEHGGSIQIQSILHEHTIVEIRLPLAS